jgi:hypothetical protein
MQGDDNADKPDKREDMLGKRSGCELFGVVIMANMTQTPCGQEIARISREKQCMRCKRMVDKRQCHHLLSHKIAKALYFAQIGEPVSDGDYSIMDKTTRRARKNYGDIMLCSECHRIADDAAESIANQLEGK